LIEENTFVNTPISEEFSNEVLIAICVMKKAGTPENEVCFEDMHELLKILKFIFQSL
jgi:hypothetical protein